MTALFSCSIRPLAAPSRLLAAALLLGGCGAEPEDTSAAALRVRFPDHADAVLSAREAFAPAVDGFRLDATEPGGETWGRAVRPEVVLPQDGSGEIRFRRAEGGEIRVRELGAAGEGRTAERAMSYRRAGGTSFWTATDEGVEEWLLLEAGVARGGEAVAAWEVEGATLRERGEAVELVDEPSGTPVLRVTAPRAYAASGRAVAAALRARGSRIELSVDVGDAADEAVLVDPLWEPAGRMNYPRDYASATLLPSGKVLLVSAADLGASSAFSAELYDPADDSWTLTAPMQARRSGTAAALLLDGDVLVVGGYSGTPGQVGDPSDATRFGAERYDPTADTWTLTEPILAERHGMTATALQNGKVLMAGGMGTLDGRRVDLSSAELYDPMTNTWSPAAPMSVRRNGHAAVLLPSGEVLVTGGLGDLWDNDVAELYDPASDTWRPAGSMTRKRSDHAMTLLPSGKILVTGGSRSGTDAELFDPATGTGTPTGPLSVPRVDHAAALLPGGKVLVVGSSSPVGDYATSAELYDPMSNAWIFTEPMSSLRDITTATPLQNGEVLVAGGASSYAERYTSQGSACTSDDDCGSRVCVEGVCCESRCTEPCHTCALSSSLGECVPQPKGWDLRMDCAHDGCDGACDGFGACSTVPLDGVCFPAVCIDETHSLAAVRCRAHGATCPDPAAEARDVLSCAPYHCDPASGTCKTDGCDSLQDCALGYACDLSGRCVPAPPAASPRCSAAQAATAATVDSALGALLFALLAAAARRSAVRRGEPTRAPEAS
ncbi:Kelch repeat-containing protein [Sorangium sp. So ce406]|uniref:Kelch repeat-containing protein n=1 Tax=Sorangium sp. So ce406 TaxID=3133311 RepID=UPI003F5AE50A